MTSHYHLCTTGITISLLLPMLLQRPSVHVLLNICALSHCRLHYASDGLTSVCSHAAGKAALLSIIALVLGLSFQHADSRNWEDFFPFGAQGVFNGASVIYFSYGGYNACCNFAEEARVCLACLTCSCCKLALYTAKHANDIQDVIASDVQINMLECLKRTCIQATNGTCIVLLCNSCDPIH